MSRQRQAGLGLLVTLLVLTLLAGAGLAAALVRVHDADATASENRTISSPSARAAGLRRAGSLTARALSYDGSRFDADVAASQSLMTAAMQQQYGASLAKVRARVVRDGVVHRATAVATSVISAGADQVQALVFLDQVTTARAAPGRQLDTNRVVVTLVRRNGTWLIAKLDAF
jgi:Mce-associated membrane protein